MSTPLLEEHATLTKDDVILTDDLTVDSITGDHDRFQHYFEKKAISENLLTGKPMRALCGRIIAQQVDPHGRSICDECVDAMENVVGMNLPGRDGRDAA